MGEPNLPNAFLVGAPKCGTTSLARYLGDHPDLFVPSVKEPHFFSREAKSLPFAGPGDETLGSSRLRGMDFDTYRQLFSEGVGASIRLDASADYLYYHDTAVDAIRRAVGDPYIVIVLRDPVQRAFSAYRHMRSDGRETLEFAEALEAEKIRQSENWDFMWHYTAVSKYFSQVKAYLEGFSKVKIVLYEDYLRDRQKTVKEIYAFLGIDDGYVPRNIEERYNVRYIQKKNTLYRLLIQDGGIRNVIKKAAMGVIGYERAKKVYDLLLRKNAETVEIDPRLQRALRREFREDIEKLQALLKCDVRHWMGE